jgi:hypothetical protein
MDNVTINITETVEEIVVYTSNPDSIPRGGSAGQVLAKLSGTDYNIVWATLPDYTAALALKAPLNNPTFTGVPVAPTATVGTNTAQIATTAFVIANAGSVSAPLNRILIGTGSGYTTDANLIYVSGEGLKVLGAGGAKVQLGQWISGYGGIHFASVPTTGNFALAGNDSATFINGQSSVTIQISNSTVVSVSSGVLINGPLIMNTAAISVGIGGVYGDSWFQIGPSDSNRASMTLYPGTTPSSLINGHLWFDGGDINMRVGGVTKKLAWQ